MFARQVTMNLKPNSKSEFTSTMDQKVIPLLQKQEGFRDEIAFIVPGGRNAVAISFWDNEGLAEAYNKSSYADALKTLSNVVEGTPQIHTYEVSNSTLHRFTATHQN